MLKYVKVMNEETKLVSVANSNSNWVLSQGYTEQEIEQSDIDNQWYLYGYAPRYTEEELDQKEKERIANLRMTPRDFLLALVDLGIDYNDIKQLKATNQRVEIELDYCNYIYRGNSLLDQLAPQFNITAEQLDKLFIEHAESSQSL